MPWEESHTVNERMHFVTRLEKGERMTDLCVEFGISRKTGHKIWSRYQGSGLVGLDDQSRAPKRIPHKTEPQIEQRLLEMRNQHPTWGGRKVRQYLCEHESGIVWPAPSTITDIYRRHGLLEEGRCIRPRYRGPAWSGLHAAESPNDVWCTDYKGQFRLENGQYCYPLTTLPLWPPLGACGCAPSAAGCLLAPSVEGALKNVTYVPGPKRHPSSRLHGGPRLLLHVAVRQQPPPAL